MFLKSPTSRVLVPILALSACTASIASAQTAAPPPAPPPPVAVPAPAAAAPAAPPAAAPMTAAPAAAPAPEAAPAAAAAPAAPAAAPGAPAAPTPPWWSSLTGDAFVDTYGSVNWTFPKPQTGVNRFRQYDVSNGFALNWLGLDGAYAADPIGGTINLRFGPGAAIHNGPITTGGGAVSTADSNFGLEYVRQAFATVKFASAFTLDAGKFDQPFGSEVPDSQLNMEYTRSLLYALNQPLFFTGLRLDYAPTPAIDLKLIGANGWNNSVDDNAGKTIAAQFSIKPVDQFQVFVGYAGGPEQPDIVPAPPAAGGMIAPKADSNWRHLIDVVLDINPTSALRFLVNGDFDTEAVTGMGAMGNHTATWYGANLAIRYIIADPFQATLRGEVFHDEHNDIVGAVPAGTTSTTLESGTLTLSYTIASHYMLMLDNRLDLANSALFATSGLTGQKSQFTSTLGIIAKTN